MNLIVRGSLKLPRRTWRRRKWIRPGLALLAAILAVSTGTIHAAADPLRQAVVDALTEIEGGIKEWDRLGSWELTSTILLGIVGLAVTGLQVFQAKWAKIVTAVLGLVSGAGIIINQNYFDADARAYHSLVKRAHVKVGDFKMQFALYQPPLHDPLSTDDYKFLSEALVTLKKSIADLEDSVLGKNPTPAAQTSASAISLSWATTAYAMAAATVPEWANTIPADADNFYFIGVANDRSATAARDAAKEQARAAVDSSFQKALGTYPQIPTDDIAHLAHNISEFGEVVSTFVAPSSETYRGYALVRVPREFAALTVKNFFLIHNLPFDPKLLDRIAAGYQTKASSVTEANEQKAAAEKGIVYIHIAVVADRAIGEVLRQAIGEVVSAPGAEVQVSQPSNTVRYFNTEDVGLAAQIKDLAEKTLAGEGYSVQLQLKDGSAEGYKVPKHQLEVWLAPVPRSVGPRISFEVQNGTPPDRVEALKKALAAAGYEVSQIEFLSGISSHDARVFYYKKSDAEEANSLVRTLAELGLRPSREMATLANPRPDFRPRHYDLRIGKDSFTSEHLR
jgi:hypothetical protein